MFGPKILHSMLHQARLVLVLLAVAVLVKGAAPASAATVPPASASAPAASRETPSIAATGYFTARYVFRSAETASAEHFRDQDVFGELRMDVTAPRSGRYEFHFLGAVRADLDNNQNVMSYDPLEDIGNTVTHRYLGNVYEAHLDINNVTKNITQVRLGRQAGTRDEAIFFDGIAADVRVMPKVNMTFYGGAAVHFYEIDWKEGDDFLGGAGIDYTLSAWTGMSFDYLSVSDKRNYLTFTNQKDNLLSFRLWQRFSQNVKATAKVRYQDGETRDLALRLLGAFPDSGAEVGAVYFRQFSTQEQQTNELSPFTDVLGPSYPIRRSI